MSTSKDASGTVARILALLASSALLLGVGLTGVG
jgi:hypothetical protein